MSKSHQPGGFSLLEVITAVTVLLVITAIAVPSLKPLIENIELTMVVKSIKSKLLVAKTRALGDSKVHCGVHFDTTSNPHRIQVFIDGPEHDGIYSNGSDQKSGGAYILPPTIVMKIEGTGKSCDILFRGDGSTKVHGMIVTLTTSKGRSNSLTVLPSTGRVKVY